MSHKKTLFNQGLDFTQRTIIENVTKVGIQDKNEDIGQNLEKRLEFRTNPRDYTDKTYYNKEQNLAQGTF